MSYVFVTFLTTTDALDFEEILKGKIPFWLVPVPREISHSCGIAARFTETPIQEVQELIEKHGLRIDRILRITR